MPKYTYHCDKCESTYSLVHSINEIHSLCNGCGEENSLNRIPVSFNLPKVKPKKAQVGAIVEDTIQDIKKDIAESKEQLKQRKYEP
jgi:hypothetical protein|tara:strand:+ start:286 stop:543 length:258 start_codon:yes stop_codon:yes gene_type:complete